MSRCALLAAVAASAAIVAGCGSGRSASTGGRLTDLRSISQVQRDFDDHAGRPRLLLLFSPT